MKTKVHMKCCYLGEIMNNKHGNIKYFDEDNMKRILKKWACFFDNHFNCKGKILDFGCGPGHVICLAKERGFTNIIGLDVDQKVTNNDDSFFRLQNRFGVHDDIKFYGGDSNKLPFENDLFDVVICCSSITQDNTLENTISRNLAKEDLYTLEKILYIKIAILYIRCLKLISELMKRLILLLI